MGGLDEAEHIGMDGQPMVGLHLAPDPADESIMVAVFLHRHHLGAPARQQLQPDAARAGEEVERLHLVFFIIKTVGEHVEEVLLGKVRRGPRLEIAGHVEMPVLVDATDYSHIVII